MWCIFRQHTIVLAAVAVSVTLNGGCSRNAGSDPPPGWLEAEQGFARLFAEEQPAEVVKICERFVRDHPEFPDAHLNLAGALESVGKDIRRVGGDAALARQHLERAATHYERYHSLVGGNERAVASRALMFLHDETGLADPVKAEAFARRWAEEQPRALSAHVDHADRLRQLKRFDEASAALRTARGIASAEMTGDEQMRAGLRAAWAATVAEHLQESPTLPPAETREFADEVMAMANAALEVNPRIFMALEAKAKALTVLAERLESDPQRKNALLAEVKALEQKMR